MSILQIKDMPAFKTADVNDPDAQRSAPVSLSMLVEWLGHPHAMWIVPAIFGFALLLVAVLWFSTLGAFYSTGLEDRIGLFGVLGESLPLSY